MKKYADTYALALHKPCHAIACKAAVRKDSTGFDKGEIGDELTNRMTCNDREQTSVHIALHTFHYRDLKQYNDLIRCSAASPIWDTADRDGRCLASAIDWLPAYAAPQ